MIQTDEELGVVREQLGRLEAVLKGLEDEVRPKSEKWFELMSEIYVEHIAKLRGEIEEYCSARKAGAGATAAARGRPAPAARRRRA